MAIALIDSTKENACRTAEANAIRAKTGGTSQITYDFTNDKGFADAIAEIPTGGITPTGNIELTQQSGTDVTNYATASVRSGSVSLNTPSVNASGLVTASAALATSGWVGSAPSSKTLQLSTQGATTITPTESTQTAVASGKYTTGAVTVAAVPTETKTATTNGDVIPTSGKFLSKVTVNTSAYFSENLHNFSTDINDMYIDNKDGSEIPYTGWKSTDYIPVNNTNLYIFNLSNIWCACYDANKNFVSFPTEGIRVQHFTDTNIKYFRASFANDNMANFNMQRIVSGEIQPNILTQTKTATSNGNVNPDTGYLLAGVTVAIPVYDGSVT